MGSATVFRRLQSHLLSLKPTGEVQKTLATEISLYGTTLHSGVRTKARLIPAMAGEGRYFVLGKWSSKRIAATVENAVDTPLCTTLCNEGSSISTVEHLLSAMEASGVDNCRIEIFGGDEVPILDGSSIEWSEAIREAGLAVAIDSDGNSMDKIMAFLQRPVFLIRNGSFIAALPCPKIQITYGIDFSQVPDIGFQWFSCFPMDDHVYSKEIASSRTFCIYEEVEKLHGIGLIKGGSLENALVCSINKGWLNPPLRFNNEPCRHKILDLVGDLSLVARGGNQGLPIAHFFAYKAGHSLHIELARKLVNVYPNRM